MKLTGLLLTLSLAANAALLFFCGRGDSTSLPSPTVAPAVVAKNPALDPLLWPNLATPDLPALLARLRAAGFPPSIIRAVVTAQVEEEFAARREKITGPERNLPPWKVALAEADPARRDALEALASEKRDRVKQLLGADATAPNPTMIALQRHQFGHLSPEKFARATALQRDYDELRGEAMRSSTERERLERFALLDKEQHIDLAKILTPAELETYDLRASPTARRLRANLDLFAPSEAEFLKIFRLQNPYDAQLTPSSEEPSPALIDQRIAAQQRLNAQIAAALGPERAADYQRSIDPTFRQVTRIATRLDLPPSVATTVWQTQQDFEKQFAATASDPALAPAARTARQQALRAEASAQVAAALGPRGFEAFRHNGGNWLTPTPKATPGR